MAKDATVSDEMAKKFATEKDTPYSKWVRGQGLDIISAHYVPDLKVVDLKPWAERGGKGVFINHEASRTSNDCYVCEIPPGGKLAPLRQLYDEMILVLDGRGSTTVCSTSYRYGSFPHRLQRRSWRRSSPIVVTASMWSGPGCRGWK